MRDKTRAKYLCITGSKVSKILNLAKNHVKCRLIFLEKNVNFGTFIKQIFVDKVFTVLLGCSQVSILIHKVFWGYI